MKKTKFFLSILFIFTILLPYTEVHAKDNGVDDLRGRWDVAWSNDGFGSDNFFILYVNDWRPSEVYAERYYAAGCMRTSETDSFMPLSLQAEYIAEEQAYDVRIYSTAVVMEYEPFVIRFDGRVSIIGNGVTDDEAGGEFISEPYLGEWTATHHDRRRTKCPSVSGEDLGTQAEVYAHKDVAYTPARVDTILEAYTVIVSSGMQVELSDGSTIVVEEYTDLFSPDVDFVGRFRYLTLFEGSPVQGEPYKFVLLDVFGDPIPGTESADTFNRCNQAAPVNFMTASGPDFINLSWDAVPSIPDEFDPGDYQITMWPMEGQAGEYGAGGVIVANHYIPLNFFEPGTEGLPDGNDFGQGLLYLEDGPYEINVWAWNRADESNGGWGSDCAVRDSSQAMIMTKNGDQFNFEVNGSISGNVSDAEGPLADVHVDACTWDDNYCYGTETDQDGNYRIRGVPEGEYRVFVWGGQGEWIDEFFLETPFHHEATPVVVFAGLNTPDINFTMEPGGSISGHVYDFEGNPLGGIGVDVEQGGYGACTDENGFYQLMGLPFGTYNIVAGRDFCGEHPFGEATTFDQAIDASGPDLGGVDFFLDFASSYYPSLHVVPAYPEIHGHEWNPEAIVTIFVDEDDDLENGFIYSASKLVTDEPTWCGEPCFDISGVPELPEGILPGYVVTMTDDEAIRVVHTTNLVWTGTDVNRNTVFGTSRPGSWIEVTSHGPEYAIRMVQADGAGYWEADFSVPGTEEYEQEVIDLQPGFHGRVIEFEGPEPDDGTLAYWHIEEPLQPNVIAHPEHEWVSGYGWRTGELVTLSIDADPENANGFEVTLQKTAVQSGDPNDDPEIGEVWFDGSDWISFDLTPGMIVTMAGDTHFRELLVETLSVEQLDETTDIIAGTAPAGREVGVGAHQTDGDFWLVVTTDANGYWTADFGAQGNDLVGIFDIHAMIWDEDGDATQTNYNFPP